MRYKSVENNRIKMEKDKFSLLDKVKDNKEILEKTK